MKLLGILGELVEPVTKLIDDLHTSTEEKHQLKNSMYSMQMRLADQVMQHEMKLIESQAAVIKAEAQGQSWLQRSWRPITMMVFLFLVVFDAFGWLPFRLADQAWLMLQIGLGGYVVGRSAEKIAPNVFGKS